MKYSRSDIACNRSMDAKNARVKQANEKNLKTFLNIEI